VPLSLSSRHAHLVSASVFPGMRGLQVRHEDFRDRAIEHGSCFIATSQM
jgi:hypothetical protein